jgi:hypothetical protein
MLTVGSNTQFHQAVYSDHQQQYHQHQHHIQQHGGLEMLQSPHAMFIPSSSSSALSSRQMPTHPFDDLSSYEEYDDHHQHQHLHHHPGHIVPVPVTSAQTQSQGTAKGLHYKERSGTPDPFCPFPQETEEVQFRMDDDEAVAGVEALTADRDSFLEVDFQQHHQAARAGLLRSNSIIAAEKLNETGHQQQQQGTMTPVSLLSREEDGSDGGVMGSIDFSSLSISGGLMISSGLEEDAGSLSYAGIARSQK